MCILFGAALHPWRMFLLFQFRRNINMRSSVCRNTSSVFTCYYFIFFLLHYGFAFSKPSFSSSHFSSTCLYCVWVWVWVAWFGGIVHFVWYSPSSLEKKIRQPANNHRAWFDSRSESVVGDVWSRTGSHVQSHIANDTVPALSPHRVTHQSHPTPPHFGFCGFSCDPLLIKGVPASRPIPIPHTTQVGPSHPMKVGP